MLSREIKIHLLLRRTKLNYIENAITFSTYCNFSVYYTKVLSYRGEMPKIKVYQVHFKCGSQISSNRNISEILNQICNILEEKDKFRKFFEYPIKFYKHKIYDDGIGFTLAKFRLNYKPMAGNYEDSVYTPIENKVIELTNLYYDSINKILLVENNGME